MLIGHTAEDGKRTQSLWEHLTATAALAQEAAAEFGAGELAYDTALLHDIGKCSVAAQRRLSANGPKVDHATAGAIEARARLGLLPAYCIAGHHGGLPNGDRTAASPYPGTLLDRLQRKPGRDIPDYSAFRQLYDFDSIRLPQPPPIKPLGKGGFSVAFFIRMLFSALVDADFLDTERFMRGEAPPRGQIVSLPTLAKRLDAYINNTLHAKEANSLNIRRNAILENMQRKAALPPGLYRFTVPTGGGKTLSSLSFALRHALAHGKRRVIYSIPYTSIIEQTAAVFTAILGEDCVLQHHSNFTYDEDTMEDERKRLATENWDAPLIITTNVQFFESLFANKTSSCRKLHNIANSVLIFDEAQILPLGLLQPCIRALAELVYNYRCTVLLMSATQPALERFFPPPLTVTELCEEPEQLAQALRRVDYQALGIVEESALAAMVTAHRQCLCIVNNRRRAQRLFALLPWENTYHLSTTMCPRHRSKVLQTISQALRQGAPCRVIATSLIEAGVDVDFPVVYREETGLDSILQAGGRCNRENKNPAETSPVYTFAFADGNLPISIRQQAAVFRIIQEQYSDIASLDAINAYFTQLYHYKGQQNLDLPQIVDTLEHGMAGYSFPFADIAQAFRFIPQQTHTLLIPFDKEGEQLLQTLATGEYNRELLRQTGQFSVSVYEQDWQNLYRTGAVEILDHQLSVLIDPTLYSQELGLQLAQKPEEGRGIFVE